MHRVNLHRVASAVGTTNVIFATTTRRSSSSPLAMAETLGKIAASNVGRSIATLAAGGSMMMNIASIDGATAKMILLAEMLKKAHPSIVDAQQNHEVQCTGTRRHTHATPTNVLAVDLIVSIIGDEPSR